MRIGFITDDFHPRVDGVVSYIDTMRKALEELGHDVFVICPKYPDYIDDDKKVIRVGSYDPLPFSKLASRMIITNRKTIRLIGDLNLDIIHSHTQSGSNFAAFRAAKKFNKPLVTTIHTRYHPLIDVYPIISTASAISSSFLAWRYYRDYKSLLNIVTPTFSRHEYVRKQLETYGKTVLNNSDLVIANSDHSLKYVKSYGSKTRVVKVPNGVDRDDFKPSKMKKGNASPVFALTSRLSGEKNQILVIEAVKILKDTGYECELVLIGDGPDRNKCEQFIKENNLSDRVKITGEVETSQVRDQLTSSDFGILASYRFDTDPLSLKEYLCMALPVIYCDDNFDSMFAYGGGQLCKPNSASIASAMKTYIELSPKELSKLSAQALESSNDHDIAKPAKLLVRYYKELMH